MPGSRRLRRSGRRSARRSTRRSARRSVGVRRPTRRRVSRSSSPRAKVPRTDEVPIADATVARADEEHTFSYDADLLKTLSSPNASKYVRKDIYYKELRKEKEKELATLKQSMQESQTSDNKERVDMLESLVDTLLKFVGGGSSEGGSGDGVPDIDRFEVDWEIEMQNEKIQTLPDKRKTELSRHVERLKRARDEGYWDISDWEDLTTSRVFNSDRGVLIQPIFFAIALLAVKADVRHAHKEHFV